MGECVMSNMMMFAWFIPVCMMFLVSANRKTQGLNRMMEENELQRQVICKQKEAIQSIRKKQHEYKNNIGNLNALLLNQNLEKAQQFMKELLEQNVKVDGLIRRSGSFVQLILDYKMEEARERGIQVVQEGVVCHDVPVDEYDVAVIINNAMNNAMEACEKVAAEERYIRCVMNVRLGYLNLYFENPCGEAVVKKSSGLVTSKANREEHGFGMQNIKSAVEKYDGIMSYEVKDGTFGLRCSVRVLDGKIA